MRSVVAPGASEAPPRFASFGRLWVQAGVVLAAWLLLLVVENLVIQAVFRGEFAGSWEMRTGRRVVLPIAFGALLPAALAAPLVGRLARRSRGASALLAGAGGALLGWGVSQGRHFASLALRVPFVVLVAATAGAAAFALVPPVLRAAGEHPRVLAAVGGAASALAWLADERILPRLYPAFHSALFVLTLGAGALVALVLRPARREETRPPALVALLALSASALALVFLPRLARVLAPADNVRMILFEHAPLEGRAIWLASLIAPPAADDAADSGTASASPPGELPRVLDWTGRDIVLVTVDALRADHVSAYGYGRPTTPSLDALARATDGVRFDAAYCPTPHTSYSITSLMTGKYMRPLIALGLGEDSDTWAALLRRYGYRTAAFFPPAVFFIDGERVPALHERGLDFEYRKEEFATPALRARQVGEYLATAPRDKPLFLWVHFFEPHEPYVAHAEHAFGAADVDRYDSEIAAADEGIGTILAEIRASRPGAIVIATADHGEEFGEHGGRYHGTTVYEEQVRVPLLIEGAGVARGEIPSVVQTIDLLPTVLAALGIPRPARLRGRDLGPLLANKPDGARGAPGLAFAETDEYTLVARGTARLVCARRAGACALYDRARDPGETHDVASEEPEEARDLRHTLTAIASEHGKLEHGTEAAWPEALRRGIAGDADAAEDVAALLDDARQAIRVKAAEVSFDLHVTAVAPAMRRELGAAGGGASTVQTEQAVRAWCALALVRMGEEPSPVAEALLRDPDAAWRRATSLAFAERGDRRGAADLVAWWNDRTGVEYVRATEIVAALARLRERSAVPALVRSLDDVRLRPFVADALGEIGDSSAGAALATTLASEAQVTSRAHEARALARLGGASWVATRPSKQVEAKLVVPRGVTRATRLRLVVLASGEAPCKVTVDGAPLEPSRESVSAPTFDLPPGRAAGTSLSVTVKDDTEVEDLFLLAALPAPDAGSP